MDKPARRQKQRSEVLLPELPPHSIDAEGGVLGCILLDPKAVMPEVIERLAQAGPEVFYELRARTAYEALLALYDANTPITSVSLRQHLRDRHQLEACGGDAYLSPLPEGVPSASNITYYLNVLLEKWTLRRLLQICTGAVSAAYEDESEPLKLAGQTEAAIISLLSGQQSKRLTIKEALQQVLSDVEAAHQRQHGIDGIPTGFIDFDKMTGGFHPGEYIVIAGRQSHGKTSLAMNIVEHVAIDLKLPVAVFSLEMSTHALAKRLLCARARVNSRAIRNGYLTVRDFEAMARVAPQISNASIFIDDHGGLNLLQLRSKLNRLVQLHGVKIAFLDHIQLARGYPGKRYSDRRGEMVDISNSIKVLAKELEIPIVVLAQLNREQEKEKNRRPRCSDLLESSAIEQDADVVALLHKPTPKDGEEEKDACPVELILAKQRNEAQGSVHLTFLKGITRFESAAKIAQEDLPV
jgi:replicative DNA helicase